MSTCSRGCCATQAEHYRGVVFGVGPQPETLRERQLDKDLSAYKSAAQTGTRLKAIGGAAELTSRASSQVEIDRGHLIRNAKLLKQVESLTADIPAPSTTPIT